jgi:uncharacterized membrane protein YgaE (UPF0421/DUF939 family)
MKKRASSSILRKTGLADPHFAIYLVKAILGTAVCYYLYRIFPGRQFQWSIISLLLVLTPNDSDSNKLSIDRTKANITGSSIGLIFYLMHQPNFLTIAGAVVTTIIAGTVIRLGNATRTALAALIIVMILEKENDTALFAFERMMCVFIGCLVAMILTFAFGPLVRKIPKGKKEKAEATEGQD